MVCPLSLSLLVPLLLVLLLLLLQLPLLLLLLPELLPLLISSLLLLLLLRLLSPSQLFAVEGTDNDSVAAEGRGSTLPLPPLVSVLSFSFLLLLLLRLCLSCGVEGQGLRCHSAEVGRSGLFCPRSCAGGLLELPSVTVCAFVIDGHTWVISPTSFAANVSLAVAAPAAAFRGDVASGAAMVGEGVKEALVSWLAMGCVVCALRRPFYSA